MQPQLTANWVLVYKLLPRLMTQPPQGMDPRLKPTLAEADQVLAGLWRAAQAMSGPSPSEPRAARARVGGGDALVICMPAPTQSPDAYFALAAEVGGGWRFLTLEKAAMGEGAVLGECRSDGSHASYGLRPGPTDLPTFLAHCGELLGTPVEHVEGPYARIGPGVRKTPDWVYLLAMVVLAGVAVGLTFVL